MRWGVVGLIVIPAGGLLVLNLILATPMGKSFVGKKVSGAIGFPVAVGAASYTPWGGAKVKELRVEQTEAAAAIVGDPFFSAASFEADVKWWSLFGDEVVISKLVCESPSLSLVRGPVGGAPSKGQTEQVEPDREAGEATGNAAAVEGGAREGTGEPAPAKSPGKTGSASSSGEVAKTPPENRRKKLSLGEVEVRGGTLRLSSFEGDELIRVDGLRMILDLSDPEGGGEIAFDRASLAGLLEVSDFVSPVVVEGRRMSLLDLAATCEGGTIGGELLIERQSYGIPFAAKLTASGIELADLLAGRSVGVKSGVAGGELFLRGRVQSPRSLQGSGKMWVESAALEPGQEFEKLRSALEVDADGQVVLDPARAQFVVAGGRLIVQEASFGSGRLLVKSVGELGMRGELNVAARVYLGGGLYSAVRSRPRPGRPALAFSQLPGTDWHYRDELVRGTVRDPRLDFWRTGEAVTPAEILQELSFDLEESADDPIGSPDQTK